MMLGEASTKGRKKLSEKPENGEGKEGLPRTDGGGEISGDDTP